MLDWTAEVLRLRSFPQSRERNSAQDDKLCHSGTPSQITDRFELEFEPKGILKDFHRADLEITAQGKMLVSAPLQTDRTKPGRITVRFAAARDQLPQITLRLVAGTPMNYIAYDFRLQDFVDPAALR